MKKTLLIALSFCHFFIAKAAPIISQTHFDDSTIYPDPALFVIGIFVPALDPNRVRDELFVVEPVKEPEPWPVIREEYPPLYLGGSFSASLNVNRSDLSFEPFTSEYAAGHAIYLGAAVFEGEPPQGLQLGAYAEVPPLAVAQERVAGYQLDITGTLYVIGDETDHVVVYSGTFTVFGVPDSGSSAALLSIACGLLLPMSRKFSRGNTRVIWG